MAVPVRGGGGGTTRSAARGDADPNARDASLDKEEAAGRLREMIDTAASEQNVLSGNVRPFWRDAERMAKEQWKPSERLITDDNVGQSFLKTWLNSVPAGPGTIARGAGDAPTSGWTSMGGAGLGAQMQRQGDVGKTIVEIEVVLAPDGTIVSSKVVRKSGRKKFDAAALKLVEKACSKGKPTEESQTMVSRWVVSAWVDVTPPSPVAGFSFDESTGKISGAYPGKKGLKTEVRLKSLIAKR
jgi:TonB family protein